MVDFNFFNGTASTTGSRFRTSFSDTFTTFTDSGALVTIPPFQETTLQFGTSELQFTIFQSSPDLPTGQMRFVVTPQTDFYAFQVSADGGFVGLEASAGIDGASASYLMTFTDGAGRNELSDVTINFGDVGSSVFVITDQGFSFPATSAFLGSSATVPIGPVTGIRFFVSDSFSLFALSGTPTCFAEGTQIATPDGPRAVQSLAMGDTVLTHTGETRTVAWVGQQSFDTRKGLPPELRPVRVQAGALGDGLPQRDLVLTADHALYIDGCLINAGALENGGTISYEPVAALGPGLSVYHIETEDHAFILAEGAPAETFLDARQRKQFDNYKDYVDQHGADRIIAAAPVPRISAARMVPAATRRRLEGATARSA